MFYEKYPGSINDISQLEYMLEKAYGYGYRHVGFILDRGYISKQNLENIVKKGYSYIIMMKGMASFISPIILGLAGTFEKKRTCFIDEYEVYGTSIKKKLYVTDEKESHIHVYHSVYKEGSEWSNFEKKLRQMKSVMDKHVGEVREFGGTFEHFFRKAFLWG